MNINLTQYGQPHVSEDGNQTVVDAMDDHLAMLVNTTTFHFTGRQALLPETDLPDAYRIWNETETGEWIWINPDGEIVETTTPMFYAEEN